MKNFKDILSEIAQPKSGDEKKFKDLHKIELIKHPVAPDSQFTGEIEGVERKTRPADQEGDTNYDPHLEKQDKPFKMPRDIGGGALRKENTQVSFKDLMNKITSEEDLLESPQEEIPMMMKQLHYICYAAEDLMEFLATDDLDPEEWWQNKLAQVFGNVKSLHAYAVGSKKAAEAEKDIDVDDDDMEETYESVDEEIASLLHEEKCECCGNEITKEGCGCDEDCPHCGGKGKVAEAYDRAAVSAAVRKAAEKENMRSKRDVERFFDYDGGDIIFRMVKDEDEANVLMSQLKSQYKQKFKEEVENVEEAAFKPVVVKPGFMQLNNKKRVRVTPQDAKLLNDLFKGLKDRKNKEEMQTIFMKDEKGFKEILDFAKTAGV